MWKNFAKGEYFIELLWKKECADIFLTTDLHRSIRKKSSFQAFFSHYGYGYVRILLAFVSENIAKSHHISLTKCSDKRLNKPKRTGRLNIYPGLECNGEDISHWFLYYCLRKILFYFISSWNILLTFVSDKTIFNFGQ